MMTEELKTLKDKKDQGTKMTKKYCPTCGGRGRVPRRDCIGKLMAYYNPYTGDSCPHETCPNCDGQGFVGDLK